MAWWKWKKKEAPKEFPKDIQSTLERIEKYLSILAILAIKKHKTDTGENYASQMLGDGAGE